MLVLSHSCTRGGIEITIDSYVCEVILYQKCSGVHPSDMKCYVIVGVVTQLTGIMGIGNFISTLPLTILPALSHSQMACKITY